MATANPYASAYNRAQADQKRLFGNIRDQYNARGALFSSAVYKPMREVTSELSRRMGEEQRQDRSFDETVRQYNINSALRLYEMLASRGLAGANLELPEKYRRMPSDFGFFKGLRGVSFLPPKSGYGPVGDAPSSKKELGEVIPRYTLEGKTGAEKREARQAADAAAGRAIQREYLELAKAQAAQEAATGEATETPWGEVTDYIIGLKAAVDQAGNRLYSDEEIADYIMARFNLNLRGTVGISPQTLSAQRLLFGAGYGARSASPDYSMQTPPPPAYTTSTVSKFDQPGIPLPQYFGREFTVGGAAGTDTSLPVGTKVDVSNLPAAVISNPKPTYAPAYSPYIHRR